MKISILGCGSFGSALNMHLTEKKHIVYLEKVEDSEIIIVAVPSSAVVSSLLNSKDEIKNQKIIICSKGFTEDGRLFSEVLNEKFPNNEILFLYGPTIALELHQGLFSSMVLAGKGNSKNLIKKEIESESLYIELSDDVVGVQVASAMKNIITIFMGIIEGSKYGQNTFAFIFTRGVQEIRNVGVALGADPDTFLGLTCIGDLVLDSRNRKTGIEISEGKKVSEFIPKIGSPQEGLTTLNTVKLLAKKNNINIPVINILYDIIYNKLSIDEAVNKIRSNT